MKYNRIIYRDKIRNYVRGLLSEDDQLALEAEISENEELRKEVANQRKKWRQTKEDRNKVRKEELIASVNLQESAAIQELPTDGAMILPMEQPKPTVSAPLASEPAAKRVRLPWRFGVAASTVILVFLMWKFIWVPVELIDPLTLPPPAIAMKHQGTAETTLKDARTAYQKKDFKQAAELFSSLMVQHPDNFDVAYYGGIAKWRAQNPDLQGAKIIFEQLLENKNDHELDDEVRYQLALVHLAQKDKEKAISYLKEINLEKLKDKRLKEDVEQAISWIEAQ